MRHKKAEKRKISPDAIYQNRLVTKFINRIMFDGKKTIAQKQFYKAMDLIKQKEQDPMQTFEKALQNVGPKVEVRARRLGGANYQVPTEVRGDRRVSLAIRWVIQAAIARPSTEFHSFAEKLAAEILDANQNQGAAIKKRDNVLKTAEANRAFSHFRF